MLFIFFAGLRSWLIYKRLRLLNFFPSGSGSWFFSSGSGSGSKEPKTPDSDRLRHPSPHLKVFEHSFHRTKNVCTGNLVDNQQLHLIIKERQRPAARRGRDKIAAPTKTAVIHQSQTTEAKTDNFVKQTRKYLEDAYAKNGQKPVCYFRFVINPDPDEGILIRLKVY